MLAPTGFEHGWRPKPDAWSSSGVAPKAARSSLPSLANAIEQTADTRFKRSNRLLDAASFGRVFQKAGRSKDRLFTVLYRKNGKNVARMGLAISKKHCRSAVGRNRLKRLVRESFRQHKSELDGLDIVVLNQSATHKADNRRLFSSLADHWARCAGNASGGRDGRTSDRG